MKRFLPIPRSYPDSASLRTGRENRLASPCLGAECARIWRTAAAIPDTCECQGKHLRPSDAIHRMACTPVATYTDATLATPCPTNAPIVQLPGSACVSTTGVTGNLGFWYAGGNVDSLSCRVPMERKDHSPPREEPLDRLDRLGHLLGPTRANGRSGQHHARTAGIAAISHVHGKHHQSF